MIKVKDKNYYINEKELKGKPYTINERYFVNTKSGEILEIDLMDYCNLGGVLENG